MNEELLKTLAEYKSLKLGCERALALLQDPDSNEFQAEKVISYLNKILKGVDHAISN